MKIVNAMMGVVFLALPAQQSAGSQKLISSGLCTADNYDSTARSCSAGQLLRGDGIVVGHNDKICLLSAYRTPDEEELTHVWYFEGNRIPQEQPTVWQEKTESFLENVAAELDWLKEKDEVKMTNAAAAIVKLLINPSARFRTKSCKMLSEEWIGPWKVKIYDEASQGSIAEYEFQVVRRD